MTTLYAVQQQSEIFRMCPFSRESKLTPGFGLQPRPPWRDKTIACTMSQIWPDDVPRGSYSSSPEFRHPSEQQQRWRVVLLERRFYQDLLNSWHAVHLGSFFMKRCPSRIIFRSSYVTEVTTVSVQGTKAHGERGVAPPSLTLTTSWEWLVRFTTR